MMTKQRGLVGALVAVGVSVLSVGANAVRAESFVPPHDFWYDVGGPANDSARDAVVVAWDGLSYAVGAAGAGFSPEATIGPGGQSDVWFGGWAGNGEYVRIVLGGTGNDEGLAIAATSDGFVIAGSAGEGFPTTAGTVQPTFAGDTAPGPDGSRDGFVAKLDAQGNLVWATYLGDTRGAYVTDVAVLPNGDIAVVLTEVDADIAFITPGAFATTRPGGGDGVVAVLSPDGAMVRWASYLGGSGHDLRNASIAVDDLGAIYVLGYGDSSDFPIAGAASIAIAPGADDLTLSKFSATGASLAFSTYVGGSGDDRVLGDNLVVDVNAVTIQGHTDSTDLPLTAGTLQPALAGATDMMIAQVSRDGTLLNATYLGGSGAELDGGLCDRDGRLIVAGSTMSEDVPQTRFDFAGEGIDGYLASYVPFQNDLGWAFKVGGDTRDELRGIGCGERGVTAVGARAIAGNQLDAWLYQVPYDQAPTCEGNCGGVDAPPLRDAPLLRDAGNGTDEGAPTGCVGCQGGGGGPTWLVAGAIMAVGARRRRRRAIIAR